MESLHVKFDFDEAIESKKMLLSSEINFLNITKRIQDYNELRNKELEKKAKLKAIIKHVLAQLKTLKTNLPRIKKEKYEAEEYKGIIKEKTSLTLEAELKEIQRRLASLSK